ncbi:hypothetical protein HPB49_006380 [Dermacentor silvarum]|uniref:Uncharacterized protein n=1 Tax=Dermacentor silvarum TaxID=543639 RepID=A0ACB8DB24_DERSI|nr:hypothetical protein HPB49_006380 [Dermacentor silvarum]
MTSQAKPDDALDFSRLQNDFVASMVRRRPDRFVGLCTVPMQSPQRAVEELKRCVTQLGMRGVIVGSHVNEWTLADRALDPFYKVSESRGIDTSYGSDVLSCVRPSLQTVQELGVGVFVHPWDMPPSTRYNKYWLQWLVGESCDLEDTLADLMLRRRTVEGGQRWFRRPPSEDSRLPAKMVVQNGRLPRTVLLLATNETTAPMVGMPAETTASICEVIFGGLLERFPRLKLCFAHGAGSFPYTVGRIQHGFDVSK